MDKLLRFLNALGKSERAAFCADCGTSEQYLRKAISVQQRLGADLCIKIDKASRGEILCEDLRPDIDWAYLRGPLFLGESVNPEASSDVGA
ncbi:helix-turn-helix domain-containing protein [Massilia sp. IC2-278]|uniref:transcriptional regulator n=1 Tax=Massilia sp. IC2-278 TaxID=2887200 RepID=UPI001E59CECD|nr:YdaS family helix-turn-helix protein [Massilia sp. IC2-278]MCC2961416.1 helix-turn-helix domain-containing protein [Massilia sp. IC2-278]